MAEEPIHQPHDKLFKQSFGDPVNAAGFLRHHLPKAIASAIDWDRLALEPGSFVDSHFRQHESDLLFSASLSGTDCLVYLLSEHQVNEDPKIALRLLRYMVRIWESCLKSRPNVLLPMILPVVLAQNDAVWSAPTEFSALFEIPTSHEGVLRGVIPDFQFRLIQLAGVSYEDLRGTPTGVLVLRFMKAERSGQLLSDPVWEESLLAEVPGSVFEMLLRYLLDADIDSDGFHRRLSQISQSQLKESAMTLAQQIRQEGRREGKLEGKLEGLREAILEGLAVRFGEVPAGLSEALSQVAVESRLRQLYVSSLRAGTLEEFAGSL